MEVLILSSLHSRGKVHISSMKQGSVSLWKYFWTSHVGGGYFWHLAVRRQECWLHILYCVGQLNKDHSVKNIMKSLTAKLWIKRDSSLGHLSFPRRFPPGCCWLFCMSLCFHHHLIHSLSMSVLMGLMYFGCLACKLFSGCSVAGLISASQFTGAMGGLKR